MGRELNCDKGHRPKSVLLFASSSSYTFLFYNELFVVELLDIFTMENGMWSSRPSSSMIRTQCPFATDFQDRARVRGWDGELIY